MIDATGVPAPRGSSIPRVIVEALVVAVVGLALAWLANTLSPRGLRLTTDYFPQDSIPAYSLPAAATNRTVGSTNIVSGTTNTAPGGLEAELRTEGMHLLDLAGAEKLFHDPRLGENLIMFVDARDDEAYAQGHIPGAFQFSPYHVEKYIADVMPPSQFAEQIVVYCTGGECEDSHSAALKLRDFGIAADKLYVFGGGMTEWEAAKEPVERGVRNSGDIHAPP